MFWTRLLKALPTVVKERLPESQPDSRSTQGIAWRSFLATGWKMHFCPVAAPGAELRPGRVWSAVYRALAKPGCSWMAGCARHFAALARVCSLLQEAHFGGHQQAPTCASSVVEAQSFFCMPGSGVGGAEGYEIYYHTSASQRGWVGWLKFGRLGLRVRGAGGGGGAGRPENGHRRPKPSELQSMSWIVGPSSGWTWGCISGCYGPFQSASMGFVSF